MPNGDERILPHFFLPAHGSREDFTSPLSRRGRMVLPERDREHHAAKLRQDILEAIQAAENQWAQRDTAIAHGARGFYLEFEIPATQAAVVDRLENNQGRSPIELVTVRLPPEDSDTAVLATVFVPETRRDYYKGKVEQYESEDRINYERVQTVGL